MRRMRDGGRGCRQAAAITVGVTLSTAAVTLGQAVPLKATPVVTGLAFPLFVTHAPGDSSRLFVVEQRGRIRVIDVLPSGAFVLRPTPLIDLSAQLGSAYLEYGTLGLAFHPRFAENGYFFVTLTPPGAGGGSVADWSVVRLRMSADDRNVADPGSQVTVLRFGYSHVQHRAGWIGFGPDGYLYATTGDGGEGDPANAASDRTLLRGKVLRLDVDGTDDVPGTADDDGFPADALRHYTVPASNPFVGQPGAAPEIWAYGLRNPWRASFDRVTGDLWIGDVGQSAREEIDFQPAASPGGEFYGWRCMEGLVPTGYAGCTPPLPPSVPPVLDIPRSGALVSSNSITGGYVYRGCAIPSLRGTYVFGDWTGKIWTAVRDGASLVGIQVKTSELTPVGMTSPGSVVSFGEDAGGELYFVNWSSTSGAVYKIEPRSLDGPDCDANGVADSCDIAAGRASDHNGNGIPDACEPCIADFNADQTLGLQDLFDFLFAYFAGESRADFNRVGGVTVEDIFAYLRAYFSGCP